MNNYIKKIYHLLVYVFILVVTCQCSKQDTLIIYSGRSDKFVKPLLAEFEKQTGIKALLHNASATSLLKKIELESMGTQADIYISNDAGNLQLGSARGLFRALPLELVKVIPESFRAPDNTWVGLSGRARVLVVNTQSKELDWVHSVFDLADPRLKNQIAITQSANESFIAGISVYMQLVDKQKIKNWLQGLKNNSDFAYAKHSAVVSAVASGKKKIGLVNHYYIYRHLAKHPDAPIKILLPDQRTGDMGIAWNVAGVAVPKYSHKNALAEKFIAFLVSSQGQQTFAKVNREYPTRDDVPVADEIPKRSQIKLASVGMHSIGQLRNETLNLIDGSGLP